MYSALAYLLERTGAFEKAFSILLQQSKKELLALEEIFKTNEVFSEKNLEVFEEILEQISSMLQNNSNYEGFDKFYFSYFWNLSQNLQEYRLAGKT
jgi:hypothetical protein